MSRRKLKLSLSESDINNAIEEVRRYKESLRDDVSMFIMLLMNKGINVAKERIGKAPPEYRGKVTVTSVNPYRTGYIYTAVIRLEGKQALFVEFSAGKTYGTDSFEPLPNNPSYGSGYGMGTYNPDSDNWKSPTGWDYGEGGKQHTYGTPAVAPLYNADKAMRDILLETAKKVWG